MGITRPYSQEISKLTTKEQLLKKTENWVKAKLENDSSGHDWWHIVRVRNMAKAIAQKENADLFICQMAALLHDMADSKLNDDPQKADLEVEQWLVKEQVDPELAEEILYITRHISYRLGQDQRLKKLGN